MPPSKESGFRARRLSVTDKASAEQLAAMTLAEGSGAASTPPPKMKARRMSVSPEIGAKATVAPPFPTDVVGTFSCHGVEPGARQGESHGKINQDRGCVVSPFAEPEGCDYKQALFCVYDGHGQLGDKASEFTMNKVQELLEGFFSNGLSEEEALQKAFVGTDDLLKKDKIDAELSGTTAAVMLYRVTGGAKHEAWVAWAGDSRVVYCDPNAKAQDWSHDHKPDTPKEMERIKKAGGFVSPPEEEWGGPARVWLDRDMTLPGLAMARSIGDHLVKKVGVTPEPEVLHYDVDPSGGHIILASDGVWEFIESQDASNIINKFMIHQKQGATEAVTKLIETAAAKWRQEEGDYRDDITAICISLSPDLFEKRK